MTDKIMRWFNEGHLWRHLDKTVKAVAARVGDVARWMDDELPYSDEKMAGIRKLLEARDCFVRATIEAMEAPGLSTPEEAPHLGLRTVSDQLQEEMAEEARARPAPEQVEERSARMLRSLRDANADLGEAVVRLPPAPGGEDDPGKPS